MDEFKGSEYLKKFEKPKVRGPHTKEQALAEQIWNHFGKRLPFGRIMRIIKTRGHQHVYEAWNDIRQSDAKNQMTLFIWRMKNENQK